MKLAIVLAAVVACALAAPAAGGEKDAQIVSVESDIRPDGSFDASYETNNGIKSVEKGEVRQGRDEKNEPLEFVARSGSFSYPDPEGNVHTRTWQADENGFRVEGADIPRVA